MKFPNFSGEQGNLGGLWSGPESWWFWRLSLWGPSGAPTILPASDFLFWNTRLPFFDQPRWSPVPPCWKDCRKWFNWLFDHFLYDLYSRKCSIPTSSCGRLSAKWPVFCKNLVDHCFKQRWCQNGNLACGFFYFVWDKCGKGSNQARMRQVENCNGKTRIGNNQRNFLRRALIFVSFSIIFETLRIMCSRCPLEHGTLRSLPSGNRKYKTQIGWWFWIIFLKREWNSHILGKENPVRRLEADPDSAMRHVSWTNESAIQMKRRRSL